MTRPAACLPAELARAHLRTIRPRDLAADDARNQQIADDVIQALKRGRHCLVLTQRTAHLELLAGMLHNRGHDQPCYAAGWAPTPAPPPSLASTRAHLKGRWLSWPQAPVSAKASTAPPSIRLFLTTPIAFKGRLVQYVGRVLRPYSSKITAEVHDYHDILTGVLASSLAKRAPGYISLGFPDPRRNNAS